MSRTLDANGWMDALARYRNPSLRSSLIQLANTVLPFAALWYVMYLSLSVSYALTLLLAVVQSVFFMRLFIIQHDCGHGGFFRSRGANNLVGSLIGVFTLFPYDYWRRTHALHHATSGKLDQREFGDIHTLTVKEYQALSPWRRLSYRVYRHPAVLLGIGPTYQFILKHRLPLDIPVGWKREWFSVFFTNVGLLAIVGGICSVIGWQAYLSIHLPVMLIAGALGVFLFYVQHQFDQSYWDRSPTWSPFDAAVAGSSYFDLPKWLHWCTGNIGFHHIHHLASQIPNYRLAQCFRENPELPRNTITLRQSLACLKLRLWDEDRREMVSFDSLEAVPSRATGAQTA